MGKEVFLFSTELSSRNDTNLTTEFSRYYIDRYDGRAYCASYSYPAFNMGGCRRSDLEIGYEELLKAAERYDKEAFQKLRGINGSNWKTYLDQFKG